jgi:GNAT superfamily N-acetyltransferase
MQRAEEKEHCRHSDGYPVSRVASDSFKIRRATVRDADVIAWHRARMFQDMGDVSGEAFEILRTKAQARLEQWIDSGDYIGWLATPADKPEKIVGGAGTIGEGRQGTIINVFTEPQWRRHGIAGLLIKEIVAWSRSKRVDRLILHASDQGRPIYKRLGFITSNEMRLSGGQ